MSDDDNTSTTTSNEDAPSMTQLDDSATAPKVQRQRKQNAKYEATFNAMRARPYFSSEQTLLLQLEYYTPIFGAVRCLPDDPPSYDHLNALLSSTYRHGDRRAGLWAAAERQNDGTLTCAYTGVLIEGADLKRVRKADEEHLVPQSWHRGSREHPGRDMHQIFIVTNTANDSRVNLVFGFNASDPNPERREGGIVTKQGNQALFFPHRNLGAVCRATLYTLVCYRNTFIESFFPPEQLQWLKSQAAMEPVTEWEQHRNNELQLLQGTRNPFVDMPQWATKFDFDVPGVFRKDGTKQEKLPRAKKERKRRTNVEPDDAQ